jgi:hypothetical protein
MATNFKFPAVGDVITVKGSKQALLVVEGERLESKDILRQKSYFGYSFKTIKIDDVGRPNPAEKAWTLDYPGSSLGGNNMVKVENIRIVQSGIKITAVKTTTYNIDLGFIGQTSKIGG